MKNIITIMLIIFMGGGSLYSKVKDEMKDYSEKIGTDNQDYFFKTPA